MTWYELFNYFDETISKNDVDNILWSMTGFPCFGSLRTIIYQIRRAIRITKSSHYHCDMCLKNIDYCICGKEV